MGSARRRLRFARGLALRAIRALVIVLTFPLVTAGALPTWASLLGLESPHICHCSVEQHECVCARCHTDPDASMRLTTESVSGRCGDDDIGFGGKAFSALAAPGLFAVAVPAGSRTVPSVRAREARSHEEVPPPTPPPRSMG